MNTVVTDISQVRDEGGKSSGLFVQYLPALVKRKRGLNLGLLITLVLALLHLTLWPCSTEFHVERREKLTYFQDCYIYLSPR